LILFIKSLVQLVVQLWCSCGAVVVQLSGYFGDCTKSRRKGGQGFKGGWCSGAVDNTPRRPPNQACFCINFHQISRPQALKDSDKKTYQKLFKRE
jgi:hypothetical protein